jgi:hypothetical protein
VAGVSAVIGMGETAVGIIAIGRTVGRAFGASQPMRRILSRKKAIRFTQ